LLPGFCSLAISPATSTLNAVAISPRLAKSTPLFNSAVRIVFRLNPACVAKSSACHPKAWRSFLILSPSGVTARFRSAIFLLVTCSKVGSKSVLRMGFPANRIQRVNLTCHPGGQAHAHDEASFRDQTQPESAPKGFYRGRPAFARSVDAGPRPAP